MNSKVYSEVWIFSTKSKFMNWISWTSIHHMKFLLFLLFLLLLLLLLLLLIDYWKSRTIQYSEFMVLNSVVKHILHMLHRSCLIVNRSNSLFHRVTVWPIPATLASSHTQFRLPELHQLQTHFRLWDSTLSLAAAGCPWTIQVHSSDFSPDTLLSQCPTYSPDWVTLTDFSFAFWVSKLNSQAKWFWLIVILKSL